MPRTATLSAEAADVLRRVTATADRIALPPGILPKPVYREVHTALVRLGAGGRWDKKTRTHLYDEDPRPDLAELLGGDGRESMTMPADRDKEASFWRTPAGVARQLIDAARIGDLRAGSAILEPSAGDGAIADIVRSARPDCAVICLEPDPRRYTALSMGAHVVHHQTLEAFAEHPDRAGIFDAVVMNPPFTLPGRPVAWAEHVRLALRLLRVGGHLAAVVPAPFAVATRGKAKDLRHYLRDSPGLTASYEALPDDAFLPSGTGVRTGVLTVRRSA